LKTEWETLKEMLAETQKAERDADPALAKKQKDAEKRKKKAEEKANELPNDVKKKWKAEIEAAFKKGDSAVQKLLVDQRDVVTANKANVNALDANSTSTDAAKKTARDAYDQNRKILKLI